LLDVQRDTSGERTSNEDDINERSGSEKDQPVTQSIFRRIVDGITLQNEEMLPGRINLNTAPQEVLATLPEVDDELASAIVRHRGSGSGYTSIGDLLDVTGMTKEKFAKLESCVTVRSNVFRIRSQGRAESDLASATIECVVDRGGSVPRILYWLESTP
jgi:type II secretory pathway component PulK